MHLTSPDDIKAPVGPEEAKAYARITHSAEDMLIGELLKAATEQVEDLTRCALVTRRFEQSGRLRRGTIELARAPVQGVVSLTIGGEPAEYELHGDRLHVERVASTRTGFYEAAYTAGYGKEARDVPQGLRYGIIRAVKAMYDQRNSVAVGTTMNELPAPIQNAFTPFMRVRA